LKKGGKYLPLYTQMKRLLKSGCYHMNWAMIVSDMAGVCEVVEDAVNGFVIPSRSVEAIKEKLLFLYENPDICKGMGRSAVDSVSSGYSWDDYGDRLVGFLMAGHEG